MLLQVRNLNMVFPLADDTVLPALRDVSFSLTDGDRLGIVGESGAGKSLLAQVLINLPPPPGKITGGEVFFDGKDLLALSPEKMRQVRGGRIAMIFQDPMTTLNPVLPIGEQLTECLTAHGIAKKKEAWQPAVERLREVAIPSPEERMKAYPHELSGGMKQRVVIAAALMTEPALIIADEPTTALDVTTQAEVMTLLTALCQKRQMGLILITHDLVCCRKQADKVMVMYSGSVIEIGATDKIIRSPRHPYTRGLLASLAEHAEDGRFHQIPGNMPSLSATPSGCPFHPRLHARQGALPKRNTGTSATSFKRRRGLSFQH